MNKLFHGLAMLLTCVFMLSCNSQNKSPAVDPATVFTGKPGEIKLVVLNPGHFHASLLQKFEQPLVNDTVFVYAPKGDELDQYLASIDAYNNREENPTRWVEIVYEGEDYLEKMIEEKNGNVVILAGNNRKKTKYIAEAVKAGFNVLSDKPMVINKENFTLLRSSFDDARANGLYLLDVMTERNEIINTLTRELIQMNEVFGELRPGTPDEPAVVMKNLHHFYKEVSGAPLVRPAWFYDVEQQGEGMVDVATHLVDLVQWQCFPDEAIDYVDDTRITSATHWPTRMTLEQFARSTKLDAYPDFLQKHVDDSVLKVFANGTINYRLKGVNISITAIWDYEATEGGGDSYNGHVKGTNASLEIIQDESVNHIKELFIQKDESIGEQVFDTNVAEAVSKLQKKYPFLSAEKVSEGRYQIIAPVEYRKGHEDFFGMVAERYFGYLINRDMPDWEISNMIAKYYTTTTALEMARENASTESK